MTPVAPLALQAGAPATSDGLLDAEWKGAQASVEVDAALVKPHGAQGARKINMLVAQVARVRSSGRRRKTASTRSPRCGPRRALRPAPASRAGAAGEARHRAG